VPDLEVGKFGVREIGQSLLVAGQRQGGAGGAAPAWLTAREARGR